MRNHFRDYFFDLLPQEDLTPVELNPLLENFRTSFITDEGEKLNVEFILQEEGLFEEAEYHGHKVQLGKIMRGDAKKFKVFVRDPQTHNIKKVNFGFATGDKARIHLSLEHAIHPHSGRGTLHIASGSREDFIRRAGVVIEGDERGSLVASHFRSVLRCECVHVAGVHCKFAA